MHCCSQCWEVSCSGCTLLSPRCNDFFMPVHGICIQSVLQGNICTREFWSYLDSSFGSCRRHGTGRQIHLQLLKQHLLSNPKHESSKYDRLVPQAKTSECDCT